MIQIVLRESPVSRGGDYEVFTGFPEGPRLHFPSMREAKAALAEIGREMTRILRELNELLGRVLSTGQQYAMAMNAQQLMAWNKAKQDADDAILLIATRTGSQTVFFTRWIMVVSAQVKQMIEVVASMVKIRFTGFDTTLSVALRECHRLDRELACALGASTLAPTPTPSTRQERRAS